MRGVIGIVGLLALGCGSEPAVGPSCGEAASPGPVAPVAALEGRSPATFGLGPCGELAFVEPGGALWVTGPDHVAVDPRADGVSRIDFAPNGGQLWATRDGGALWLDLDSGATVAVDEVRRTAFAGDLAWACDDEGILRVEPEGAERLAAELEACGRAWPARAAPILVYLTSEGTLARLHLESGAITALDEVPYEAIRGDTLALSPDGRVLHHRARAGEGWLGVFDLDAPAGERLLAALSSPFGAVPEPVEAPGAGHVAAVWLEDENATVILTDDLWLNRYDGARFHAFAPGGDRALLRYPREGGRAGFVFDVAHLDGTRLEATDLEGGSGASVRRSARGGAVATLFHDPYTWAPLQIWRWADGVHRVDRPDLADLEWVDEVGTTLVRLEDDALALLRVDGRELARWAGVRTARAWSVRGGEAVLVRMGEPRASDADRLVVVDAERGASAVLSEGAALTDVAVDAAGERVAFLRDGVLWAGALP